MDIEGLSKLLQRFHIMKGCCQTGKEHNVLHKNTYRKKSVLSYHTDHEDHKDHKCEYCSKSFSLAEFEDTHSHSS